VKVPANPYVTKLERSCEPTTHQRVPQRRACGRSRRLSIQSLHSLKASSAASLLSKIVPLMCLISTTELKRPGRRIVPCEYQSNPVAKVGTAEPEIKNPCIAPFPIAEPFGDTTENSFRCQARL